MRGCRWAVATTSMLMLPATKTRPMRYSRKSWLCPDFELLRDGFDVGNCRQSGLVAEALNFVGRCRAREIEMVVPAFAGIAEVGIDIGAVKNVAGAVGIEHAFGRDRKRGKRADGAGLVIPKQATFSHGDAADPAAPALEIIQHVFGRQVHLLAQPFGDNGRTDEFQELLGVGGQAAAIERCQDAGLAAQFRIMDRSIRLVALDMQRAAAAEIEQRERMGMLIVASAHARSLAGLWPK